MVPVVLAHAAPLWRGGMQMREMPVAHTSVGPVVVAAAPKASDTGLFVFQSSGDGEPNRKSRLRPRLVRVKS
jgi:hypothetical protein